MMRIPLAVALKFCALFFGALAVPSVFEARSQFSIVVFQSVGIHSPRNKDGGLQKGTIRHIVEHTYTHTHKKPTHHAGIHDRHGLTHHHGANQHSQNAKNQPRVVGFVTSDGNLAKGFGKLENVCFPVLSQPYGYNRNASQRANQKAESGAQQHATRQHRADKRTAKQQKKTVNAQK